MEIAAPAARTLAPSRARPVARGGALFVGMAAAIVAIAALAYWDERRESEAALVEFAEEQANVAAAIASLAGAAERDAAAQVLAGAVAVERQGETVVLVKRPGDAGMTTARGLVVARTAVDDAVGAGRAWARLDRAAAASLGLPGRTAMAGLRAFDVAGARWTVAVVATAQRQRDREKRAEWRLLLGVALASGLVLAFGGIAARKQRTQLELARELAVADAQRERDDVLVRADKLATLAALATGIAHEVSTPLGVIVGRAEQLAPKLAGDERAKRSLDVILEQSGRISHVIRGFLRLARGESPTLERVDPSALARKAAELVVHRFEQRRVRLALDAPDGLPRVACEARLFEQVLANLLLNACDACDAGGSVALRVRADGERVAFVVVDDGAGITAEAAARATEPFFTTKPPGEGSGLGLAIANEIVEHHQGTLAIGPRSDARGTRACVDLPAVKEAS